MHLQISVYAFINTTIYAVWVKLKLLWNSYLGLIIEPSLVNILELELRNLEY